MVRFLVHRAVFVVVMVAGIFAFGGASYQGLPRESAPEIDIPVVIVSTPYIGVSPEDIEGLVTIPIENELASLTDVKKMSSSSAEGVSIVSIEFEPEVDIDDALQKVRDRVNRAKSKLPGDAEEPSVSEVSFSDIPILLVTIAGPVDEQALKQLAEDLEDDVTRISGVLEADVTGGREREIRVQIVPERLGHYGLSLNDVTGAIQGENVNIPGGDITSGSASFLLRTPGEFTDVHQIERVAVKRVGDRPVFITDLGRVVDTFEERQTYSRMNGSSAVTLAVKKRSGANILSVAEEVKALAAEHAATWPEGVRYSVLGDQSSNIEDMVKELENNIITALILVVGVILAFMGVRNSLFVAVSIPLAMFTSFLVLDMLGFTLNMVVLFALILALGMLVDNAIVVVENVYRHLEMGKSRIEASIDGTNEVAIAVAASTATTVAAFFPLVFWTGIMGQFMGYLPKTLIIVLIASLFVAVMILPVLTSRLMSVPKDSAAHLEDEEQPVDPSTLGPVMTPYLGVLEWSIRRRYLSFGLGILTLFGSIGAYAALNHGIEFFPATEPDRATVAVRLPEGADLEATDRVVRLVEGLLSEVDNVETFVADVGVSGGGSPLEGATASSNQARVTVDFLPAPDKADPGDVLRVEPTSLTMVKLRHAFATIPGAEITIEPEDMGPPVGDPIAVEVSGDDFHAVGEAAQALMREIGRIEGVTDLKNDYRVGRPELRLRVDRGAAKRVGVSTQAVGGAVRTAIAGSEASALRDGEDEYDIVVELVPEARDDLQQVLALRLPGREDTSPNTFPVPLSAVASYEIAGGAGTIKHIDQDLVVTITGDVLNKDEEAMIRQDVEAFLDAWEPPAGIHARLGGAQDEQLEAQAFIGWAFAVAVVLVALVLIAQFNSVLTPGIIMVTVGLSLVGVLWGLILTGTPFGIMMTGIGVISLAGVVVNNAIVLLDYVEQLMARGVSMHDALIRAGITRFRPVMLTAITTTLGLIPMAVGASIDFTEWKLVTGSSSAQFWGPMAVAVIFGLSFATVLTLVMVPTLYAIVDDFRRWGLSRWERWRDVPPVPTESVAKLLALGLALAAAGQAHAQEPMTFDQVWDVAQQENLDLQLVHENTVQASTYRWQALSAVMPRLSADASYVINQDEVEFDFADSIPENFADIAFPDGPPEPTVVQPKQSWSGSATIYQPLFSGQSIPAWMSATRVWKAAQADEQRTRHQIRGVVARAYYGLEASRRAVAVAERSVEIAESQLDLATRQVAAGLADKTATLQAELGLSRAKRRVMASQQQLVAAQEAFAKITGLPGDTPLIVPDRVEVPASVDQALNVAYERRPDLEASSHRIKAAQLERTARDLEWLPTADFTFTEIYNQIPGFVPENFQWRVGFNFSWTIFDGGLRIARSRELRSRTRQAEIQQELTRRNVREDVRTTWERLQTAEVALQSVRAEVTLAEENLALIDRSYEAGRQTWLDVQVARVNVEEAQLALIQERANRDLAAIELLISMGDL